jgi:hypothetical protein
VSKDIRSLKSAGKYVLPRLAEMMFIRSGNTNGQANVMGFENLPKSNSGFMWE